MNVFCYSSGGGTKFTAVPRSFLSFLNFLATLANLALKFSEGNRADGETKP